MKDAAHEPIEDKYHRLGGTVLTYHCVHDEGNGHYWELDGNNFIHRDQVNGHFAPDYPVGSKLTCCAVVLIPKDDQ